MNLLLGHLVGDYVLQWHKMGINKKTSGYIGFMYCFVHCVLYTCSVCLFIQRWDLIAVIGIFLSHWIVDRYKWLQVLHSRFYGRPTVCSGDSLGVFCYIALDNTIHLVLMFLILKI